MARILITGASGMIGRKLMTSLTRVGHDLLGLDIASDDDPRVAEADLVQWNSAWTTRMQGAHAVVHLAATAWPDATWPEVTILNIDMTLNVLQAAAAAGVRRVVLASSNWVLAGHRYGEGPLDSETPPAPVNAYGASKLFGERAGLSFHRSHGLSVICLRIGAAQERPDHLPRADGPLGGWAAQMWLSEHDLCEGVRLAVEAPGEVGFAVLNLMSANPGMRWDLSEARSVSRYVPRDAFALTGEDIAIAAEREKVAKAAYEAKARIDDFVWRAGL